MLTPEMRQDGRPFLYFHCGRDWYRGFGFRVIAIVAPYPEQVDGELCAALLNAEVHFCLNPLRLSWHFYTPRRDRIAYKPEPQT